uniref:Uncharacterized protein n=1 Tax=Anopheles merus TaxID=30066 RepID=A0A182UZ18_ANOME
MMLWLWSHLRSISSINDRKLGLKSVAACRSTGQAAQPEPLDAPAGSGAVSFACFRCRFSPVAISSSSENGSDRALHSDESPSVGRLPRGISSADSGRNIWKMFSANCWRTSGSSLVIGNASIALHGQRTFGAACGAGPGMLAYRDRRCLNCWIDKHPTWRLEIV